MAEINDIFVPTSNIRPIKWLVQGLIPLGGYALIASQPAVGKSFFVEALGISIAYDEPFLDIFEVTGGNVLIVDEDTESEALTRRLTKYSNFYNKVRPYDLHVCSKQGYSMDNNSLTNLVNNHSNLRLVIIDCLVSVVGGADIDRTIDVKCLTRFLQNIAHEDMTVIINHHISAKRMVEPEYIMTCQNPQALLMNNTRIVSASDSLYLLASPDTDGTLKTLMIRPVPRRTTLRVKPFSTILIEKDSTMNFEFEKTFDAKKILDKNEKRVLSIIEDEENVSVLDVLNRVAKLFSEQTLREVLHSLENKEYLELIKRTGKGGKLVYRKTDKKTSI